MATFAAEYNDRRKKNLQLATNESDHRLLKAMSDDAGLTFNEILHLLMEAAHLRVDIAKESTEIDPDLAASTVETFLLLLLHDLKLLTEGELRRALVAAHCYPSKGTKERIKAYSEIINGRIKQLEPIWVERRRRLAEWESQWDAQQAAEDGRREPRELQEELA